MRWVVTVGQTSHQVCVDARGGAMTVALDGRTFTVDLVRLSATEVSMRCVDDNRCFHISHAGTGDGTYRLSVAGHEVDLVVQSPLAAAVQTTSTKTVGPAHVLAPIPGKVVAVKVAPGDAVTQGQPLVVLEAMKMENELAAEQAGTITAIHVEPGSTVGTGEVLVELE